MNCGKKPEYARWFGQKCILEEKHLGFHSWDDRYVLNSKVELIQAAGFSIWDCYAAGWKRCNRCDTHLLVLKRYGISVAPSGFKANVKTHSVVVCALCEEVDHHIALSKYLAPFLDENKSLANNRIIHETIEEMLSNIERLRECLEPEPIDTYRTTSLYGKSPFDRRS